MSSQLSNVVKSWEISNVVQLWSNENEIAIRTLKTFFVIPKDFVVVKMNRGNDHSYPEIIFKSATNETKITLVEQKEAVFLFGLIEKYCKQQSETWIKLNEEILIDSNNLCSLYIIEDEYDTIIRWKNGTQFVHNSILEFSQESLDSLVKIFSDGAVRVQ